MRLLLDRQVSLLINFSTSSLNRHSLPYNPLSNSSLLCHRNPTNRFLTSIPLYNPVLPNSNQFLTARSSDALQLPVGSGKSKSHLLILLHQPHLLSSGMSGGSIHTLALPIKYRFPSNRLFSQYLLHNSLFSKYFLHNILFSQYLDNKLSSLHSN